MPPGDNPRTRRRLAERRHRESGQGGAPTFRGQPLPAKVLAATLAGYTALDLRVLLGHLDVMR